MIRCQCCDYQHLAASQSSPGASAIPLHSCFWACDRVIRLHRLRPRTRPCQLETAQCILFCPHVASLILSVRLQGDKSNKWRTEKSRTGKQETCRCRELRAIPPLSLRSSTLHMTLSSAHRWLSALHLHPKGSGAWAKSEVQLQAPSRRVLGSASAVTARLRCIRQLAVGRRLTIKTALAAAALQITRQL